MQQRSSLWPVLEELSGSICASIQNSLQQAARTTTPTRTEASDPPPSSEFQHLYAIGRVLRRHFPSHSFWWIPLFDLACCFELALHGQPGIDDADGPETMEEASQRRWLIRQRTQRHAHRVQLELDAKLERDALKMIDPNRLPGRGPPASAPTLSILFGTAEKQGRKRSRDPSQPRQQQQQQYHLKQSEQAACQHFLHDWHAYSQYLLRFFDRGRLLRLYFGSGDPFQDELRKITWATLTTNPLWRAAEHSAVRLGRVSFPWLGLTPRTLDRHEAEAAQVARRLQAEEARNQVSPALLHVCQITAQQQWQSFQTQARHQLPVTLKSAWTAWLASRVKTQSAHVLEQLTDATTQLQSKRALRTQVWQSCPKWIEHVAPLLQLLSAPNAVPPPSRRLQALYQGQTITSEATEEPPFHVELDAEFRHDSMTWEGHPDGVEHLVGPHDPWCSDETLQLVTKKAAQALQKLAVIDVLRDWFPAQRQLERSYQLLTASSPTAPWTTVQALWGLEESEVETRFQKVQAICRTRLEDLRRCHQRWIWQQQERLWLHLTTLAKCQYEFQQREKWVQAQLSDCPDLMERWVPDAMVWIRAARDEAEQKGGSGASWTVPLLSMQDASQATWSAKNRAMLTHLRQAVAQRRQALLISLEGPLHEAQITLPAWVLTPMSSPKKPRTILDFWQYVWQSLVNVSFLEKALSC